MGGTSSTHSLDSAVRTLASASRALRLYPATSPIPRESVSSALVALDEFFETGEQLLSLSVKRDGFAWRGETVATGVTGVGELIDGLRGHGVAEIDFVPGVSADELLTFLAELDRNPDEVRSEGGLALAITARGVDSIRVTDVQLTVVEQVGPADDQDVDEFLRQLINDPEKLSAWFSAASAGDPRAFEEGLMELVRVAGPSGYEHLLESLSSAFTTQSPDGRDALLGLSMKPGASRDLTSGMFRFLSSGDIAISVLEGSYGRNMLSLSNALTTLPLEQVTAQVRAEVQAMLPGTGHTAKEAEFLEHMIEVRESSAPEPALVDANATYRAVVEASALTDEMIVQARGAVTGSASVLNAASVRTMLALLDQQSDFELYCASATNLAGLVPKLLEQGDYALANRIVTEIAGREARDSNPEWPDLSSRLREALAIATGPASMAALMRLVARDPEAAIPARAMARYATEAGTNALVTEAVSMKADGLTVAEGLIGRRIIDALVQIAPHAQWFQLGPIVGRLAREGDPRTTKLIESLMSRPDEQSRREVVSALAESGGPAAPRVLAAALRDPSPEVAIAAARAIGRSGQPGSAALLAARLGEIDVDGSDFLLGRELIGALARCPEPAADDALGHLASRRALIKRGHFAEVQDLVGQAQRLRASGGVVR